MIIVLMGVMGSGKTTIGRKLAEAMGCPFYDGDDFHPRSNREKMEQGIPLTDEDRASWLEILWNQMNEWGRQEAVTVLACSALKQKYRDLLSKGHEVQWIYLKGDQAAILPRLENRKGHFAGPGLLESQIKILEEPTGAIVVDIREEPEAIVRRLADLLKGSQRP